MTRISPVQPKSSFWIFRGQVSVQSLQCDSFEKTSSDTQFFLFFFVPCKRMLIELIKWCSKGIFHTLLRSKVIQLLVNSLDAIL